MRAAARLLFWRENRLYRQTEGTACGSPFSYSQQQSKGPALFFRSDGAIALHRMAAHWQRCRSRKVNSGRQCVPQSPRRPEPRPRVPRFAAHLRCVSAKGRFGVSRGARKPFGVLAPFVSAGRHRPPPPPDGGAYFFSSAEEASAACAAFFVLFPGLPITLSMYAGTS